MTGTRPVTPPRRRKRFGQHFLHDGAVIRRIVAAIAPAPGLSIVEIGPGRGALTRALLQQHGTLAVIEVDRDLAAALRADPALSGRVIVHEADALAVDFSTLGRDLCVVGNLPYNISTPLLFHLLAQADVIARMVFMLQKEVVDRICAAPGGSDYGRLSVMIQARCAVERLFTVGPGAFQPPPRVDSAVVRLVPLPAAALAVDDAHCFEVLVRAAFQQRRKMLRNGLRNLVQDVDGFLAREGVDGAVRPETLTVAQFAALGNALAAARRA